MRGKKERSAGHKLSVEGVAAYDRRRNVYNVKGYIIPHLTAVDYINLDNGCCWLPGITFIDGAGDLYILRGTNSPEWIPRHQAESGEGDRVKIRLTDPVTIAEALKLCPRVLSEEGYKLYGEILHTAEPPRGTV